MIPVEMRIERTPSYKASTFGSWLIDDEWFCHTLEDMIRHAQAVGRGVENALLIVDMPFLSYQVSTEEAMRSAGRRRS